MSVTLTTPPAVLGGLPSEVEIRVMAFVSRNRDVLLEHWNGEIDTGEVFLGRTDGKHDGVTAVDRGSK